MKKLSIVLVGCLLTVISFAQELDNQVYLRMGYSNPMWNYYGMEKSDWGSGVSKFGAQFELGTLIFNQSLRPSENMAFGVNLDILYCSFNTFNFDDEDMAFKMGTMRMGSKIGPVISYVVSPGMAIDVYGKADVAWAAITALSEKSFLDPEIRYGDNIAIGISAGLNFRYKRFIFGAEFNTIKAELNDKDPEGGNLQEELSEIFDVKNSNKSKMTNLNFSFGYCFR